MADSYPPFQQWELFQTTIPATAGNVEYVLSPGAGYRFILLYGRITLVCDGNAANREFKMGIYNSTPVRIGPQWGVTAAITAGQTREFSFIKGSDVIKGASNEAIFHVDVGLTLVEGTDAVRFIIQAGLVGDSYSGFVSVLRIKL